MQAILWLRNPINVGASAFSVLVADVSEHDASDKSVVVSVGGGFKLYANYEHALFADSDIAPALWIIGGDNLIPEAADVRLPEDCLPAE